MEKSIIGATKGSLLLHEIAMLGRNDRVNPIHVHESLFLRKAPLLAIWDSIHVHRNDSAASTLSTVRFIISSNLQHPCSSRLISVEAYRASRLKALLGESNSENMSAARDQKSLYKSILDVDTKNEIMQDATTIFGRIKSVRSAGKKLLFLDCWRDGKRLQIVCNAKEYQDFLDLKSTVAVGDICEFNGKMGQTPAGQTSLFAVSGRILSPCLRPIPVELTNDDTKLRSPILNFLVNPLTIERLKIRSKLTSHLRSILKKEGFYEVETPILSALAGGANAKPFETNLNALDDLPLKMRIAPELFLKQLIIGGFEQVFEIGKQFRNEGIDATHNPEFTTCELYKTYTTLEEMMAFTERILIDLVSHVREGQVGPLTIYSSSGETAFLDLTKPFKRIWVVEELEKFIGEKLPLDLFSQDPASGLSALIEICNANHIPLGTGPHTIPKVLDKMVGYVVEPNCIQPTFVLGHPIIMSPLSKSSPSNPLISDRFELFIGGKEYVNAYEELNDPQEQRARFVLQQADRNQGDTEAQVLDENFCVALDYGLPPTVGWGLGIDRLCMLVTDAKHIRDVIAFPIAKPK